MTPAQRFLVPTAVLLPLTVIVWSAYGHQRQAPVQPEVTFERGQMSGQIRQGDIGRWQSMTARSSPGHVQCVGYALSDVAKSVETHKEGLVAQLSGDANGDELAGMRSYVVEFYPKPQFSACGSAEPGPIAEKTQVEAYVEELREFVGKLNNVINNIVILRVVSVPTGAKFVIGASGGGQEREISTNDEVKNLRRGYYLYRVTKNGFKKIETRLNLVDEDVKGLECILRREGDRDDAVPCKKVF